jgi:hypothetical protein
MGACSPSIRKDEMYIEFRAFVDSASCLDSPDSTVSVDPYLGKSDINAKMAKRQGVLGTRRLRTSEV